MGKDVDQIVVGANGTIRVAPVGTAAPASEVAAPAAGWIDVGYSDENGVTMTDSKTFAAIPVWQLFYPARRIITDRDLTLGFVLRQWNKTTVPFAFGGGTLSIPTAGHFKYVPPAPEKVDERALMVDWIDGTKIYRLIVPRGLVTENVATNLTRTAASDLPIGYSIIGDDAGDPWTLLTNDPALDPT